MGSVMRTILLSFEPNWFDKLEKGEKKFEYRKNFPEGVTKAYFYVSNPVKAITGIAIFGEREKLEDWKEKYKDRPLDVKQKIDKLLINNKYAVPMLSFQPTNKIPLAKLRQDIPNFIVPRMYYYIDDSDLMDYLDNNLIHIGELRNNNFSVILDEDIY